MKDYYQNQFQKSQSRHSIIQTELAEPVRENLDTVIEKWLLVRKTEQLSDQPDRIDRKPRLTLIGLFLNAFFLLLLGRLFTFDLESFTWVCGIPAITALIGFAYRNPNRNLAKGFGWWDSHNTWRPSAAGAPENAGLWVLIVYYYALFIKFEPAVALCSANWLVASMRDSNLGDMPADKLVFGLNLILYFLAVISLPQVVRAAVFVSNFILSLSSCSSLAQLDNNFERSFRSFKIVIESKHSNLGVILLTTLWLAICYGAIFAFIAYCPGPVGSGICNWFDGSLYDAGVHSLYDAGGQLTTRSVPQLRIFLAAVCALYAGVPLALMCCSVLPVHHMRTLSLSEKGIDFSNASILALFLRPLRSWDDLSTVEIHKNINQDFNHGVLKLNFKTPGTFVVKMKHVSREDLIRLFDYADQQASQCIFGPNAMTYRREQQAKLSALTGPEISGMANSDNFSSTVFVPHHIGDELLDKRIRIIRIMAVKARSAVYLVRLDDERLAVLKQIIVPVDGSDSERLMDLRRRESSLLSLITNPNVAKLLEVFEKDYSHYTLIEHIRGINCLQLVRESGAQSEQRVISWALQIAHIVKSLHEHQPIILHRDLTPDNLILCATNQLKLIDFGAAQEFVEGITTTLVGKQNYIAPEQLRGKASLRSDIYTYGATLYFFLTGKEPIALSQAIIKNSNVSDKLKNLVARCTRFEEKERPESFASIIEELEAMQRH